jgi:hypothetical protein
MAVTAATPLLLLLLLLLLPCPTHLADVCLAAVDKVQEPPGCGDDELGAAAQRCALRALGGASIQAAVGARCGVVW